MKGFTHGLVMLGHLQGVVVNWREGKKRDAAIQFVYLVYDGVATWRHMREET